jgi:hypothetical protein
MVGSLDRAGHRTLWPRGSFAQASLRLRGWQGRQAAASEHHRAQDLTVRDCEPRIDRGGQADPEAGRSGSARLRLAGQVWTPEAAGRPGTAAEGSVNA